VLADPDRYRDAYDKPGVHAAWMWDPQADVLDRVYAHLVEVGGPR
jgi:glycogen synthase